MWLITHQCWAQILPASVYFIGVGHANNQNSGRWSHGDPPGHGLVDMVVLGWRLDLMILEVFSNLNDSMILLCDSMVGHTKFTPRISCWRKCAAFPRSWDFWHVWYNVNVSGPSDVSFGLCRSSNSVLSTWYFQRKCIQNLQNSPR